MKTSSSSLRRRHLARLLRRLLAHARHWFAVFLVVVVLAGCGEGDSDPNPLLGGEGTPTIWFTSVPPVGSSANLTGSVTHVRPLDYWVTVYIYVGGWWVKPYSGNSLTAIDSDGNWSCDIVTGGRDDQATIIAAFLIPRWYSPPQLLGADKLPAPLYTNSAAYVQQSRVAKAPAVTRQPSQTDNSNNSSSGSSPDSPLAISLSPSNTVLLTWPTTAPASVLQESFDRAMTNWITATQQVQTAGGFSAVSLERASTNHFFRLWPVTNLVGPGIVPPIVANTPVQKSAIAERDVALDEALRALEAAVSLEQLGAAGDVTLEEPASLADVPAPFDAAATNNAAMRTTEEMKPTPAAVVPAATNSPAPQSTGELKPKA